MELKIYNPQDNGFLQKIEWNYEELKAEISAAAKDYEMAVYTDDTVKAAKADRAKLNKFVDALKGRRTEIRKMLLSPDEQFGQEINEIVGIVQRAIDNIDTQVKDYEFRQREEKKAKIQEFYEENIADLAAFLPFDRVFKPQYANASTTMKSIKEEIVTLIQKVAEGLAILNEVDSPYISDMKAVFLRTYDIGTAMAERNRLEQEEQRRKEYEAERARQKAERDARIKEQAGRVMQAGQKQTADTTSAPKTKAAPQPTEQPTVKIYIMDFRVHATQGQLNLLKDFLQTNNIRYEPVPKGE